MRKTVIMLLSIVFLSASVWATPWFNITDAYIQQLDQDSYRIRVFVDFGGINFISPYDGSELMGQFYHFTFGPPMGTSQYNPTTFSLSTFANYDPGDYWAGDAMGVPFSMDNTTGGFGYDFDHSGPLADPVALSYSASFFNGVWTDRYDPEYVTYTGSFTARVLPEPTTLLLFGLGLTGAGLIRRKKR